jgi:prepilin-type N-terminal cleavage/methylation domain-containing protein
MKLNDRKSPRPGFTLVELLVVMAIIAILVSLTAAAVMKILSKRPEVLRRSEISQLGPDISQFKAKFDVGYMPSFFVLRSNVTQYNLADKLERESLDFLKQMFKSGNQLGYDSSGNVILLAWGGYDPNGNPLTIPDGQRVILTGDQCLVFFLGGITAVSSGNPPTVDCQGFSSDKRNPTALGGDRIPPFFKFVQKRLVKASNGFYSYNDPYGVPYAYFSSYKVTQGYNRYVNYSPNPGTVPVYGPECPTLGVSPYYSATGKYYNANTFQIISAGPDQAFGPGGQWTPGAVSGPTADDMSNFSETVLGAQ